MVHLHLRMKRRADVSSQAVSRQPRPWSQPLMNHAPDDVRKHDRAMIRRLIASLTFNAEDNR